MRAWRHLPPGLDPLLLVVGDGPERRRFERQAQAMAVTARFLGARWADRPDIYASTDLLVCPHEIASFGVVLLEGMAAGLPVVASRIDGFSEVLTDEREGLLVDTAHPAQLAATLADLLRDGGWRRRLGQAGRLTAAGYDWSHVTGAVLDQYADLRVSRA